MAMTVHCTSCQTEFPVDPAKVPEEGVWARCSECQEVFRVERPLEEKAFGTPEPEVELPAEEPAFETPVEDFGAVEEPVTEDEPILEAEPTFEAEVQDPAFEAPIEEVVEEPALEAPIEVEEPVVDFGVAEEEPALEAVPTFEAEVQEPAVEAPIEVEEPVVDFAVVEEEPALEAEPTFEAEVEEPVQEAAPEEVVVTEEVAPAEEPVPEPEAEGTARPKFGRRDPKDKAARLARVLVSDIVLYNSARHAKSLEAGTIREDFQDEVDKSWGEYVEQVGNEIAESTDFWREALNEILTKGEELF